MANHARNIWAARRRRTPRRRCLPAPSDVQGAGREVRELSQKRIRRGSFASVRYPKRAMHEYVAENNTHPEPFVWTASVDKILAKVNRCKSRRTLTFIIEGR